MLIFEMDAQLNCGLDALLASLHTPRRDDYRVRSSLLAVS